MVPGSEAENLNDYGFVPEQAQEPVPQAENYGFVPDQAQPETKASPEPDIFKSNSAAIKNYVNENLKTHYASEKGKSGIQPAKEADSFLDALQAGLQISTAGLGIRQEMPSVVLPEHTDRALRIAYQIGEFAGDLPAMAVGGFGGALTGAVGGGLIGGTIANIPGALIGAGVGASGGAAGGAFAVPAALRKALMDHIEKGDIKDTGEFVDRLMATTWEAVKGGVTGVATATAGGLVKPVAGAIAAFGAELGTMTTVGAALEGHLPTVDEFIDGAIVLGGLHGVVHVAPKLRAIYAETGERPAEIVERAQTDVELKQKLLTVDPTEPTQPLEGKIDVNTEGQEKIDVGSGEPPKGPPEEKDVLSKIGKSEDPLKKTFKEKFQEWYAKSIDYLDPLASIEKAAKEEQGVEIKPEDSAYVKGRLFAAHMDKVRGFFEFGTRDATTGEVNGEGLNTIYKEAFDVKPNETTVGGMDGFRAYGLAKRALELDERGIEPWENFDRESAQKVVDDNAEHYEELNQRRVDFENRVLEYGQKKGLFSEEQLERMKEANKAHFPFNRVQDADVFTGKVKGGSAVKRIFGSDKDILDPILQTYKNTENIIRKSEINDVRVTALNNLREAGMLQEGDAPNPLATLKKVDPKMLPIEVDSKELSRALAKQGINLRPDDITLFRPDKTFMKENQIAIIEDGKRTIYEGSPLVIDTLKRLDGDKTAMDLTTKIAKVFATTTRMGVVLNPAFGFRHFFRSQIMSGVYSETGMIPFYHAALALKDFMHSSKDYQDWLYHGGATSSWFKVDDTYFKNNVLEKTEKEAPVHGKAWNVVKKVAEASEAFIKLTDNAARFAEYKRSVEQGVNKTEAAYRAREVVPDYQKIGLNRSALRMSIAFIGAHINSTDRMVQEWKTDPMGATLKASALTAISTLLWVTNNSRINPDTGKFEMWPDPAIDELPDWQKNTYWNFNISRMFGDTNKKSDSMVLRVPKPWAPGIIFGSGAEVALDQYFKDKPHEVDHFVHSVFKSVFPEAFPNIAQPILDQYANRNGFTGRPLVSKDKEKLLPELQYEPYTSETAKQVAKLIGYVPLVKDFGPTADPLASPAVVDNYIRAWSGTVGSWVLKIADKGIRKIEGKNLPEKPSEGLENTPFFMEFVSRYPNAKAQSIEDFYTSKDEVDKVLNSINYNLKRNNPAAALKLMNEYPDLQVKLEDISKGIADARKTIHEFTDAEGITPVEKRQIIDTVLFQMMSMAKMGNQRIMEFKKSVKESKIEEKGE